MHCWPFLSTKIHQKLSLQPAWLAWEKVFRNSECQWTLPSFTTNYPLNYKRLPTCLPSVTFLWKQFHIEVEKFRNWEIMMYDSEWFLGVGCENRQYRMRMRKRTQKVLSKHTSFLSLQIWCIIKNGWGIIIIGIMGLTKVQSLGSEI